MIIRNGAKRLAVIRTRFHMFIPRAAISSVLVLLLVAFRCGGLGSDGGSCCDLLIVVTENAVATFGADALLMECAHPLWWYLQLSPLSHFPFKKFLQSKVTSWTTFLHGEAERLPPPAPPFAPVLD